MVEVSGSSRSNCKPHANRLFVVIRWVNIFVTLGVWALELNVDRDDFDDDGESIVSWNRD
jgi:hypothetical protein